MTKSGKALKWTFKIYIKSITKHITILIYHGMFTSAKLWTLLKFVIPENVTVFLVMSMAAMTSASVSASLKTWYKIPSGLIPLKILPP